MLAASTPFFPAYASNIFINFVVGFTCTQTGLYILMPLGICKVKCGTLAVLLGPHDF